MWAALEDAQEILEELSAFYVEVGEDTGKNEAFKKSETIEKDVQRAIEAGQNAIKVRSCKIINMNTPLGENTTDRYERSAREDLLNESHHSHNDRNRYLKPLKVSTLNGDKRKFEDFLGPLYKSNRRVNRASKFEDGKAATMPHRERLGSHPWSRSHRPRIRGGQRDIKNEVWRYAPGSSSLLGSTRTGAGEVEDGTLHSLLVKKLPDRQLENYSRWLNERAR